MSDLYINKDQRKKRRPYYNIMINVLCAFFSVETNSWFDYVLDWERVMEDNPDYPIHVMFFEDMKAVHVSYLSNINWASP